MASELKSATSRTNGAKSKGPKSPETRQISSRNSVTHGFTARKTVVLACENPEQFQKILDYYADTYQPGSPVEEDLVGDMVAACWRTHRLRMIETALLDSEIEREPSVAGPGGVPLDGGYKIAFAFRRLVDESHAISLASRYESRLHRIHERSYRTLRELQQTRMQLTAESAAPVLVQPEQAPPFLDTPALPPDPVVEPALPSNQPCPNAAALEKNDKTNLPPASTIIPKNRKPLLIVEHRRIRRIGLRYFGQRKAA